MIARLVARFGYNSWLYRTLSGGAGLISEVLQTAVFTLTATAAYHVMYARD